jgi:uncharacterized protein YkwD
MTARRGKGIGLWALLALLASTLIFWGAASPATAEAACKKAHAKTSSIPKERARKAVRCLVNKKRSNLHLQGQLTEAAQGHSAFMARKNCFSHLCPGEAPLKMRITRTGYLSGVSSYGYGEVIAKLPKQGRPVDVVRMWMNSPPHRDILLNGSYDHIGVGLAIKRGYVYYTGVVGRRSG